MGLSAYEGKIEVKWQKCLHVGIFITILPSCLSLTCLSPCRSPCTPYTCTYTCKCTLCRVLGTGYSIQCSGTEWPTGWPIGWRAGKIIILPGRWSTRWPTGLPTGRKNWLKMMKAFSLLLSAILPSSQPSVVGLSPLAVRHWPSVVGHRSAFN